MVSIGHYLYHLTLIGKGADGGKSARNEKADQVRTLTGFKEKISELVPDISRALFRKLCDGSPCGLLTQG